MNGNPKEAPVTARILFKGVMLTCINGKKQYEVGMIQCPVHEPEIIIETKQDGVVQSTTVAWPSGHDLLFQVTNPEAEGVSPYQSIDQETDFKRIIDLEGPDLHSQGVSVKTDLLQGRRLGVTAGNLYTHALTDLDFHLMTWTDQNDEGTKVRPLGKIADVIGLNIVCREGADSGITIVDLETGKPVAGGSMPALLGTTYTISVTNDCSQDPNEPEPLPDDEPIPAPSIGTDFRFYYDFVETDDGVKFDLAFDPDSLDENEPEPSPGACENGFLSQTDTLGLKS